MKFQMTMEENKKNKLQQMQELTRREVLTGIDSFEHTLKNLGLNKNDEEADQQEDGFSPKKGKTL